jgi:hypothetical protein
MITKIKLTIFFLVMTLPITLPIFIGIINYSGFCFAKRRYLSYEEKILIVFNHVNLLSQTTTEISVGKDDMKIKVKYIPYTSFEEFSKLNPNCCGINLNKGYELPRPEFMDRITGYRSGEIIDINFKFRYASENGYIERQGSGGHILTNCGRVIY